MGVVVDALFAKSGPSVRATYRARKAERVSANPCHNKLVLVAPADIDGELVA